MNELLQDNQSHNPPEDGFKQSFSFLVEIEDYVVKYRASTYEQPTKLTFENNVVGSKDVVFDIDIIISQQLEVILRRKSQRLDDVFIPQCCVFVKGSSGSLFCPAHFKMTTLKAASTDKKFSAVTLREMWKDSRNFDCAIPTEGSFILPNGALRLQIMGMAFYRNPIKLTLHKQLECLFNNTDTKDVTLIVGEEKFETHKWLLSARSPVFQAMFNSNMKESSENTVTLTDDNPRLFEEVLKFMYTDTCPNLSSLAPDLLVPADKYNIEGLRSICENEMMKHLSVENVCDYMVKSAITNSTRIYGKCLDFFLSHVKDVLKTQGWAEMKTSDSASSFMPAIIERLGVERQF